jgi:hypothetical protein
MVPEFEIRRFDVLTGLERGLMAAKSRKIPFLCSQMLRVERALPS